MMEETMSMESKKSKAQTPKKLRGVFFKVRMKSPKGIVLDNKETKQLIDLWKEDMTTVNENTKKLVAANDHIDRNLNKIPDILTDVLSEQAEAQRYYKQTTKDPVKKREWARRLIVSTRAADSIKKSQRRMEAMKQRIEGVVRDASIEKKALDVRISEAEAYVKMGEGVRLVGDTLIAARTRASEAKVQFGSLEFMTENLEDVVGKMGSSKLIEEANKLLGSK